jgi:hypothetical protein
MKQQPTAELARVNDAADTMAEMIADLSQEECQELLARLDELRERFEVRDRDARAARVHADQAQVRVTVWHPAHAEPAIARAAWTFDVLSLIVPPRISNEEVGDAMERISSMVAAGQAPWRAYLLMVMTVFWVLVHAAHAIVRGVPQKKGG